MHDTSHKCRISKRAARSQEERARSQEERARSTEQKLESLVEQSKSTEGKLTELGRGQADLTYAQIGHVAEMANIMGRISSVEVSLHGTPSPSPIPGRR